MQAMNVSDSRQLRFDDDTLRGEKLKVSNEE